MLRRKTPLKARTRLKPGKPLARKPMKKSRKKDTSTPAEKLYYAWLAEQPCVAHGTNCEERHHVRRHQFGSGGALKPPHWFAIPLSEAAHKEQHNRGRDGWEAKYGAEAGFIFPLWERYGLEKVPQDMQERLRKYNYANS